MSNDFALVDCPLSNAYRARFEQLIKSAPKYLWLTELRRMPMHRLVRMLLGLRADRLFIALESDSSKAFLPIFQCFTALASSREIALVHPDLRYETLSRWRSTQALLSTAGASVAGQVSLRRCRGELAQLERTPRIEVQTPARGPVLYLRTNLTMTMKTGGSVGHVAGVVNGLQRHGWPVEFAAMDGPLMVDPEVIYHPIRPPKSYGIPYDMNLYRFQETFVHQAARLVTQKRFAFLYQRMSVGNYAGAILSRRARMPLILEYNGSEIWAAKNWGAALRCGDLGIKSEEMSLKHAHLVVTVSDVLRDELIQRGVEPGRIVCYPNCIDPTVFDPERFSASDIRTLREHYGIPTDAIVASFVGTFGPWHGVEVMAEAIRQLVLTDEEWLRAHRVHFLIVGDGLGMPAVRNLLSDPRCRPFYTLTGMVPQDQAASHMAAADILLSPHVHNSDGSRFFGSPTKLFEYMGLGKAILAAELEQIGEVLHKSLRTTDLPANDPLVANDEMAVLFKPGDVDDLRRGFRFLVERQAWRSILGNNARRETLSRYTWDRHTHEILQRLTAVRL